MVVGLGIMVVVYYLGLAWLKTSDWSFVYPKPVFFWFSRYFLRNWWFLPSGKRLHSYGKIHHFQWENPLFRSPFSIATLNYQRVPFSHLMKYYLVVYSTFFYGNDGFYHQIQRFPVNVCQTNHPGASPQQALSGFRLTSQKNMAYVQVSMITIYNMNTYMIYIYICLFLARPFESALLVALMQSSFKPETWEISQTCKYSGQKNT